MSQTAILLEQFISSDGFDGLHPSCPQCGGTAITVLGHVAMHREEIWRDGKCVSFSVENGKCMFEITAVECPVCQTRFFMKSIEIMNLEDTNQLLRRAIQRLTGKDPFGDAPPN